MKYELEHITNVIQELDNQTKELKHFSSVLKKIDDLFKQVEKLVDATKENSEGYENIIIQLDKRKKELDDEMQDVILIAKQMNAHFEERFKKLEDNLNNRIDENNKNLIVKIENNHQLIFNELSRIKEQVSKKKGIIF